MEPAALAELRSRGLVLNAAGKGVMRCPGHDDENASLSVRLATDRLLLRCHAGCTVDRILDAIDCERRDLFTNSANCSAKPRGKAAPDLARGLETAQRTLLERGNEDWARQLVQDTLDCSLDTLAVLDGGVLPGDNRRAARVVFPMHDAELQLVGVKLRPGARAKSEDVPGSKTGILGLATLRQQPEAAVLIHEGEHDLAAAAEALPEFAHLAFPGVERIPADLADAVRGRSVVVVGQADTPGRKAAEKAAALVAASAATLRLLDWSALRGSLTAREGAEPKDVADLIRAGQAAELRAAVDAAEPWTPSHVSDAASESAHAGAFQQRAVDHARRETADLAKHDATEAPAVLAKHLARGFALLDEADPESRRPIAQPVHAPFPVEALPNPLRRFVEAHAAALGADVAMVALPSLAAVASAIGSTRRLALKRTWRVPAILWCAVVARSGSGKSPGQDAALRVLRDRQSEHLRRFAVERAEYERAKRLAGASRNGSRGEPPTPPTARRLLVSDSTLQSVAPLLAENPRGLLMDRDELSAWIGSFNQYDGGSGDAPAWLELYGARPLTVDRKTGEPRTIHVPHPALSIAGTVQVAVLRRLSRMHLEDGLLPRFILTMPPRRARRWPSAEVPADVEADVERLFDNLLALEPQAEQHRLRPGDLTLTAEARAEWIAYYNEHGELQATLEGSAAAFAAKLEETAARLALVLHLVRVTSGDPVADPSAVDAESMRAGIVLARWAMAETERILTVLESGADEERLEQAVGVVRRHGGRITAAELRRSVRWIRTAAEAREWLLRIHEAGLGTFQNVPPTAKGGAPTLALVLAPAVSASPKPPTPGGSGDTETPSDGHDEVVGEVSETERHPEKLTSRALAAFDGTLLSDSEDQC